MKRYKMKKRVIKAYSLKRNGYITVHIPKGKLNQVGKIVRSKGYTVKGVHPKKEVTLSSHTVSQWRCVKSTRVANAWRRSKFGKNRVVNHGGGKNPPPGGKKFSENDSD